LSTGKQIVFSLYFLFLWTLIKVLQCSLIPIKVFAYVTRTSSHPFLVIYRLAIPPIRLKLG
jgi:hypothetical protein